MHTVFRCCIFHKSVVPPSPAAGTTADNDLQPVIESIAQTSQTVLANGIFPGFNATQLDEIIEEINRDIQAGTLNDSCAVLHRTCGLLQAIHPLLPVVVLQGMDQEGMDKEVFADAFESEVDEPEGDVKSFLVGLNNLQVPVQRLVRVRSS